MSGFAHQVVTVELSPLIWKIICLFYDLLFLLLNLESCFFFFFLEWTNKHTHLKAHTQRHNVWLCDFFFPPPKMCSQPFNLSMANFQLFGLILLLTWRYVKRTCTFFFDYFLLDVALEPRFSNITRSSRLFVNRKVWKLTKTGGKIICKMNESIPGRWMIAFPLTKHENQWKSFDLTKKDKHSWIKNKAVNRKADFIHPYWSWGVIQPKL